MLPDSGENFRREIAEPFLQVGEPLIQHRHQILGFKGVIPGHDGKGIFTDQNPDTQAFAQLLSLPLIVAGIVVLAYARRTQRPQVGHVE